MSSAAAVIVGDLSKWARRLAGPLALLACLLAAPAASAESVLGIPCEARADGIRECVADGAGQRVPSWDGVPLDVDVFLPPASIEGPYPTIVYLHGFGGAKSGAEVGLAARGYAVVQYSARGFGASCGLVTSRLGGGCERGWSHLADLRYEPRDTQHLLGLLVDAGVTDPRGIGVTGTSYGAGQSLMLATLRNRVAMPGGRLVRWRSPNGTPLRIAAAAPNWPWSDLAAMLVPNGSTLDYLKRNPYGPRIGVPKLSYVALLAAVGGTLNYFALPGTDFGSDAYGWVLAFVAGEPYGDVHRRIVDEIRTRHSPLGIDPRFKVRPAPVFANAAWADDLTTPTEILRWRNAVLAKWPKAIVDVYLSEGPGHPRAAITGSSAGLTRLQHEFWDRHLKGKKGKPLGIRTVTQACDGAAARGPFKTRTWAAQHPGEVRFRDAAPREVSGVGDPVNGALTDPVVGVVSGGCATTGASDAPGTATYRLPPAPVPGYTVIGSPTVRARIDAHGPAGQVAARLWDVSPNGRQTLMARVAYRPRTDDARPQVFQLHPAGWYVRPGHVVKLELLGADQLYVRASNGPFTLTVSDLELRLPVREKPRSVPGVRRPAPPLARTGKKVPKRQLFVER